MRIRLTICILTLAVAEAVVSAVRRPGTRAERRKKVSSAGKIREEPDESTRTSVCCGLRDADGRLRRRFVPKHDRAVNSRGRSHNVAWRDSERSKHHRRDTGRCARGCRRLLHAHGHWTIGRGHAGVWRRDRSDGWHHHASSACLTFTRPRALTPSLSPRRVRTATWLPPASQCS